MIIKVRNTLPLESQKTFTSFDEPAAAGTIRWKNPNVFQASWGVQIGETGEERAEIMVLGGTAPAGTAGTFSSTSLYEHPADTPMYAIKWDQIVFKRSTSGTAGTPTALTDGTITIQPDAGKSVV